MRERWMLGVWLLIPVAACESSGDRGAAPDANGVTAADATSDAADDTALGSDSVATAPDAPDSTDVSEVGDATEVSETAVSDTQLETVADTGPDPYGDLPILQRPLAPDGVTCMAARVPDFALTGYFPSMEVTDGPPGAPFAHYAMTAARGFEPIYTIQLAPLEPSGVVGTAIYSKELGEDYLGAYALTASGNAFALIWHLAANNPPITYARVGTDGALLAGPIALAGTAGYDEKIAIEPGVEGAVTVLWQAYDADYHAMFRMGRFTVDGTPIGEVVTLVPGDAGEPEDNGMGYAMRADGGVVVAWARSKDSSLSTLRVASFDATGAALGTPQVVTSGSQSLRTPALVRHGAGFLLAWAEGLQIRVQRLALAGDLVGAAVALGPAPNAPDKPLVGQPIWLAAGGRAALAWAMPDHAITVGEGVYPLGWVLVDPATLAPASNLLRYEDAFFRDGIRDGAINHVRMASNGQNFRAYYGIHYHAGSSAGAADITCLAP